MSAEGVHSVVWCYVWCQIMYICVMFIVHIVCKWSSCVIGRVNCFAAFLTDNKDLSIVSRGVVVGCLLLSSLTCRKQNLLLRVSVKLLENDINKNIIQYKW